MGILERIAGLIQEPEDGETNSATDSASSWVEARLGDPRLQLLARLKSQIEAIDRDIAATERETASVAPQSAKARRLAGRINQLTASRDLLSLRYNQMRTQTDHAELEDAISLSREVDAYVATQRDALAVLANLHDQLGLATASHRDETVVQDEFNRAWKGLAETTRPLPQHGLLSTYAQPPARVAVATAPALAASAAAPYTSPPAPGARRPPSQPAPPAHPRPGPRTSYQ